MTTQNNAGKWKLAYIGPALVISSGLVYTGMTKPKGLTLDDILEMIKEHPRVGHYEKRLKRRLTLGDALARGELEKLGTEVEMVSSIDFYKLNVDRDFKKLPKSGGQLLSSKWRSKPNKISYLNQKEL